MRNILRQISCIVLLLICVQPVLSQNTNRSKSILIVSSYNPSSDDPSQYISDFMSEFGKIEKTEYNFLLESLDCKSFSEAIEWPSRFKDLLEKYKNDKPALMILLGQEAWSVYLSLPDSLRWNIPVIPSSVSKNYIEITDSIEDTSTYLPVSHNFNNEKQSGIVHGGFFFHYDVEKNLRLALRFFPKTRNIALLTDNTYGGVALQARVREEMKKYPMLNFIPIDGRTNTVYSSVEKLLKLPSETVLLLGTWRIDKNNNYFLRNIIYSMKEALVDIPTFSLTQLGMGHWAIGGLIPTYNSQGAALARLAYQILSSDSIPTNSFEVTENEYVFDAAELDRWNLSIESFDNTYKILNQPITFYQANKYLIWTILSIVFILMTGLLVSLYYYSRTRELASSLLKSSKELVIAKDKAEEANRLKTAFLASVTHEIRTPLNAIVGFSDYITSGECPKEEQREYFDIIHKNSDMLLHLINDIIDVASLESDHSELNLQKLDAVLICRYALESIEKSQKSTNRFHFESDFTTLYINSDLQRLQQVLFNLLSNANKFSENGDITLMLKVDKEKNVVLFSVTDMGCGIPADKRKEIFNRFIKLDEYKQGTGLGLPVCQLIVAKWNGEIWVDPTYNNGARFIFSHPYDEGIN